MRPLTAHRLAAMELVLRYVGAGPVAAGILTRLLASAPTDGIYSVPELLGAVKDLVVLGLVGEEAGVYAPSASARELVRADVQSRRACLLTAAWTRRPPAWLPGVIEGREVAREVIPVGDEDLLGAALGNPAMRDAFLMAMARRFQDEANVELGIAGEEAVVSACRRRLEQGGRADLATQVLRVSLVSDQLGYDVVSPTLVGTPVHLEVKCTRGTGDLLTIYLSRNEAETALGRSSWRLVVCRSVGQCVASVVGWCSIDVLQPMLPRDCVGGVWQSARISLPGSVLSPGVPL